MSPRLLLLLTLLLVSPAAAQRPPGTVPIEMELLGMR
jgi:hypothetical protein